MPATSKTSSGGCLRISLAILILSYGEFFGGWTTPLHAQASQETLILDFALRAPRYEDSVDIGRHAAFSIVLGKLVERVLAESDSKACKLTTGARFPDLRLILSSTGTPGSTPFRECLDRIWNIVVHSTFERTAFQGIAEKTSEQFKPNLMKSGDLTRPDLKFVRLRIVGLAALTALYKGDPVLEPLLGIDAQLRAAAQNFDGFGRWLDAQRASENLGFVPLLPATSKQLEAWHIKAAKPSTQPNLQRSIARSAEVRLQAPATHGKTMALVRCDSLRVDRCEHQFFRAFCRQPINRHMETSGVAPAFELGCRPIDVLGLSGWFAIETNDDADLKWFSAELALGRMASPEIESSTIEFVILIKTDQ